MAKTKETRVGSQANDIFSSTVTTTPQKKTPVEKVVEKPKCLDKLLSLSSKLSKGFKFVRVDLYLVNDEIYFGELTFHPGAGFCRFRSLEVEKMFGDLLDLHQEKK